MNRRRFLSFFIGILIFSSGFNANAENLMTAEEINAIHMALDDEYKAYTTYQAYLEHFGEVKPFSNIVNSEKRHIEALSVLLEKQNLSLPDNPYKIEDIKIPGSLKQACEIAVEAEVVNDELYRNELLPAVSSKPDIIMVFENLADASKYRHLKAFERCVERF